MRGRGGGAHEQHHTTCCLTGKTPENKKRQRVAGGRYSTAASPNSLPHNTHRAEIFGHSSVKRASDSTAPDLSSQALQPAKPSNKKTDSTLAAVARRHRALLFRSHRPFFQSSRHGHRRGCYSYLYLLRRERHSVLDTDVHAEEFPKFVPTKQPSAFRPTSTHENISRVILTPPAKIPCTTSSNPLEPTATGRSKPPAGSRARKKHPFARRVPPPPAELLHAPSFAVRRSPFAVHVYLLIVFR